jgi:hypothetical protein
MRTAWAVALGLLMALQAQLALAAESETTGPFAYVSVAGAPGDGEQALAAALSRQLAARGLKPANAFQANVYEVQGTVRMAPAGKGKESVTIVWSCSVPTAISSASRARPRTCAKARSTGHGAPRPKPPRLPRQRRS